MYENNRKTTLRERLKSKYSKIKNSSLSWNSRKNEIPRLGIIYVSRSITDDKHLSLSLENILYSSNDGALVLILYNGVKPIFWKVFNVHETPLNIMLQHRVASSHVPFIKNLFSTMIKGKKHLNVKALQDSLKFFVKYMILLQSSYSFV